MNDFLETIIEERRKDVESTMARISIEEMQRAASEPVEHPSLVDCLSRSADVATPMVVAEVKQASPSAGLIRENYDPAAIALEYEKSGAVGVSVLTEPRHFLGRLGDIEEVKKVVSLPVLRKDFITEIFQLYESVVAGADVVLLIACAMSFNKLRDLYVVALAIGLEVVIEIHAPEELEMVLPLAKAIIGVNNRNLKTLETDLNISRELAEEIPAERITMAESGIKTRADIEELRALGYNGFLIGESLLRFRNPGMALRQITGRASLIS